MGHYTYANTHTHTGPDKGQVSSQDSGPQLLGRPFGLCCKLFRRAAHATNKTNSSFKFPKIYKFMWRG